MQGEYHWHKHENDDEFFFVLDGHFIIDLEDRSVDLQPREGFVVPTWLSTKKSRNCNEQRRLTFSTPDLNVRSLAPI